MRKRTTMESFTCWWFWSYQDVVQTLTECACELIAHYRFVMHFQQARNVEVYCIHVNYSTETLYAKLATTIRNANAGTSSVRLVILAG